MYAIIGGGIAGLTLALAFEKKGIDYHLYEKAEALAPVGAGIWLAPNALQVLEWLGILKHIQKAGNKIERVTIANAQLRTIHDVEMSSIRDLFGYTTVAIHRADLQAQLLQAIPKHKISLGKAFAHYHKNEEGQLRIYFKDQSVAEAQYLIGADGIHSAVRQQLFPKSVLRYAGQCCWRGIAPLSLEASYQHQGVECWGGQHRIGWSPIGTKSVYWFAVSQQAAGIRSNLSTTKDLLLKRYQHFHPLVQQIISATTDHQIIQNDIYDLQTIPKWYSDKACLIGDAAHATTPNMGQGGAQAIEDVYSLVPLLQKQEPKQAFALFQQNRQQKVNKVVRRSWQTGKMAHWQRGKGLRNLVLSALPKSLMLKQVKELYRLQEVH